MNAVRDCPKCGSVTPPTAQHCNCGYGKRDGLGEITFLETLLCVLLPGIGFCWGLIARLAGRRPAGNAMMIISALMIVIPLVFIGLFALIASVVPHYPH